MIHHALPTPWSQSLLTLFVVLSLLLCAGCSDTTESTQSTDTNTTTTDTANNTNTTNTDQDTSNTTQEDTLTNTNTNTTQADTHTDDTINPTVGVSITNGVLYVNGAPFVIQGVGWNPVPAGGEHPRDLDYAGYVEQDSALMQQAGINVVRTYEAITDRAVLDALQQRNIYVLNTVYAYGGEDIQAVRARIEAVADHPAILMWLVGNEWNYNGMYVGLSHEASLQRVRDVVQIIRSIDQTHPIATVYGELPSAETLAALPEIDVWGINAYRGLSFGDLFDVWQQRSPLPMFLAEFGADAWNANIDAEDQASQSQAVVALIGEIGAHRADQNAGPCLGGAVFEFADEWWKDGAGRTDQQDIGGVAPGGGPFPDATFNEEWWGIVDINRTPRLVFTSLPTTW